MITAEEVVRGLLDSALSINQRIDMALVAGEFEDSSVRAALETIVGSQEKELVPYACTALVSFWLREGTPDRELFHSLSYEGKYLVKQALLHEAPEWLVKL